MLTVFFDESSRVFVPLCICEIYLSHIAVGKSCLVSQRIWLKNPKDNQLAQFNHVTKIIITGQLQCCKEHAPRI